MVIKLLKRYGLLCYIVCLVCHPRDVVTAVLPSVGGLCDGAIHVVVLSLYTFNLIIFYLPI